MDVIRAFAIICVICVHFFANTPFLDTAFEGWNLFLQGVLYILFSSGVPLFLLLTGYLNIYKKPDAVYYRHITRILMSYVFISIVTWFVLSLHNNKSLSIIALTKGILGFKAIGYAWYVEMYIGLFLLIPFLNMIWEICVKDKKNVLMLLGTLFFISSIPCVINRHDMRFLPHYWTPLWVLLYYFTGGGIRHFYSAQKPFFFKKHLLLCLAALLACCSFNSLFSVFISSGKRYMTLTGIDSSPFAWLIAVIIFIFMYQCKNDNSNGIFGKVVRMLALYSFDIYLFSYMFDRLFYPWIMQHLFISQTQIVLYFIPIVGCVLLCSFMASWIKERLISMFMAFQR